MSCSLKKFSDIFGKPRTGIHSYRFLDTAIVDYIGTIFFAIIFTKITKIPLVLSTIFMFVLSIILHSIFGVQTNTLTYLGISC